MGRYAELILKIGLAFAFVYPPVAAFFDPIAWIGYFPGFLRDMVGNDTLLLHAFGVVELGLAAWLLLARNALLPSLGMAGLLAGIILFNWGQMDVVFRDVSILAIALALACASWERRKGAA